MQNIILKNGVFEVRFPYDAAMLAAIRNIPGRQWKPDCLECYCTPLSESLWRPA